jgi:hypothetical protein
MSNKDIGNGNEVMNKIIFFVPVLTIVVGSFGSFCNIIIFRSKELRSNSCAFYFLCSTIFDLIYLLLSGITRLINDHFPILFLDESVMYCKCRTYLVIVTPTLSTYFLMFASIDRCLSTSTSKKSRYFIHINIAWRIAIFSLVFLLISNSHIFIFFELQRKNFKNNIYKCVPRDGIYRIFVSIYLLLSSPFLVYMIMLICTIITLIRIRRSRNRVRYSHNKMLHRRNHNMDRHLITILIIQVGLGMFLTFFRGGFLVYSLWTNSIKKIPSQINFDLFLDKISLIIYYMNFAKSFPVNILTSTLFRQVFQQRFNYFIRSICHSTKGIFYY